MTGAVRSIQAYSRPLQRQGSQSCKPAPRPASEVVALASGSWMFNVYNPVLPCNGRLKSLLLLATAFMRLHIAA